MRDPYARKFHEIYETFEGPTGYAKAKGISRASASALGQQNKQIFLR